MERKRDRIAGTDIIIASMHFVMTADEFIAIILGMSRIEQVESNLKAWKQLKEEGLIYEKAQAS